MLKTNQEVLLMKPFYDSSLCITSKTEAPKYQCFRPNMPYINLPKYECPTFKLGAGSSIATPETATELVEYIEALDLAYQAANSTTRPLLPKTILDLIQEGKVRQNTTAPSQ